MKRSTTALLSLAASSALVLAGCSQPVLEVAGVPDAAALDAAWELGASLAALLATGVA